jgi:hypothetical protein
MTWRYQAEKQCNDRANLTLLKALHFISPFFPTPFLEADYPQKNASGHTHSKAFLLMTFGGPAIMAFRL